MQEGGYNTDYIGQHASGVAKALIGQEEYGEPTQADRDAGFTELEKIKSEDARQWAKDDVAETSGYLKNYWNCI